VPVKVVHTSTHSPRQRPWIVPIPGTRRLERLDENLGAVVVGLTADDLAAIDTAAAGITVHGDRYP
jgi:aryl-alcohol dehydrogenase-like predicted oxidoreductase